MDYLFLHRDKRTFTSERQRNLLFRAARLYWEQKYADSEVVPKRKVDCELYKYVLYYLEVRQVFLDPKLSLKKLSEICLLYTSPSPRDGLLSRMPSSA